MKTVSMQQQPPRVVMLGDSSVGKTSIVDRICQNRWTGDTRPTVSTAFYTLKGNAANDEQSVQIWDTAGAERYRSLNSVYYHNAMGGVLVFDLTSRPSFDALESWFNDFTDLAQPGAIVVIVGNKLDIYATAEDRVKVEDAEKWAKRRQLKFFTTSAQTGVGITELTDYLLSTVPQRPVMFQPTSVDIGMKRPDETEQAKPCC
jgi:small GTP-binding protein